MNISPYMDNRECSFCGEEFFTHRDDTHRRYCSQSCCWRAWRARNPDPPIEPRKCKRCGLEFIPPTRKQLFCSKTCCIGWHNEARRPTRVLRSCAICGHETRNPKFCSLKCRTRAEYEKQQPPSQRCVDCGTAFRRQGRKVPHCPTCLSLKLRQERAAWERTRILRYPKVVRVGNAVRLSKRPKTRSFTAGECSHCGENFVAPAWQKARFCSGDCATKAHRQLRRDRKRAQRSSEKVYRRKVFERDSWTCRICFEPVSRTAKVPDPLAPTLDHAVPLSLGGEHVYHNVQCAHFGCNSRKSNKVTQLAFAA